MKSLEEATTAIQRVNIIRHFIMDDGTFPNNALLPLLIYQQAIQATQGTTVKDVFESNRWVNSWEDTIYSFHHYHSSAHEVLGVIKGMARIQFGGPNGIIHEVNAGDIIVIPAGVSHCCIESDQDFKVVGAYPEGQNYDLMKGQDGERPAADQHIKSVPIPQSDPVFGEDGPLNKNWQK